MTTNYTDADGHGARPVIPIRNGGGAADLNTQSPVTQIMTVGTGAGVAIPSSALSGRRSLFIRALTSNTGTLFIGSSTVTADEASTGGKKLYAGDEFADDIGSGTLYVTSDTASQKLYVYER